jgi:hypothetical protein
MDKLAFSRPFPQITSRINKPDFLDLPWQLSLTQWEGACSRLETLTRGVSRHPVVFVNYDGQIFALKELPQEQAKNEYNALIEIERLGLPCVEPIGYTQQIKRESNHHSSVLITRFLDYSLPYRSLFMRSGLHRYRRHLLDALAGLLVQLHLAGVFWGDCSFSNTLFRRDAGLLQAYLVDAETTEIHPARLSPTLRHHDLQIMEENVVGELHDLAASDHLAFDPDYPLRDTGGTIRVSYQSLWEEITREMIIHPNERYRIQERIRALNGLGFSVRGIEFFPTDGGDQLRFKVVVTDRNFHQNQLYTLTGLDTEEMQARQMMNEIQEIKAALSNSNNRSTPLSVAAFHWLINMYQPVINRLQPLAGTTADNNLSLPELYCQVLEHKWYLSERANRDVGHIASAEDYLGTI